jgi:hypothetical protein
MLLMWMPNQCKMSQWNVVEWWLNGASPIDDDEIAVCSGAGV